MINFFFFFFFWFRFSKKKKKYINIKVLISMEQSRNERLNHQDIIRIPKAQSKITIIGVIFSGLLLVAFCSFTAYLYWINVMDLIFFLKNNDITGKNIFTLEKSNLHIYGFQEFRHSIQLFTLY